MRLLVLFTALLLAACSSSDSGCKDDYDCDGTMVCNLATHTCEVVRCTHHADCLDPKLACVDNACVERAPGGKCRDDGACVTGEHCNLTTFVCTP